MSGAGIVVLSIVFFLANAFFVAAEYALVGSRSSRIEALKRTGNRTARVLVEALDHLARYVAGVQVAISMLGIGIGAFTEPYLTAGLETLLGQAVPPVGRVLISILIITFLLVVVGELVPKYLTLQHPEKVALWTIRPLQAFMWVLTPLTWLVQRSGALILRPFGISLDREENEAVPKDELLLLVRSGGAAGMLKRGHAELVTRALKIDVLVARDIMVHRLDIKWLDINLAVPGLKQKLREIPYGRMPVCRGDIDDVAGVAYLHDIVKNLDRPDFKLEQILRPPVLIPESLSIDRIVSTMRDSKTQILLVVDEYGGTSGLITLEDVVEEVFGELEDRLESERPPIESLPAGRVSARADVRLDELIGHLGLDLELDGATRTLAQVIVDELGRVPRPGDSVPTPLGLLRVDNMARRRVTRVSLQLLPELRAEANA